MNAALAWEALLAGNRRYASDAGHHPRQSAYRRAEVLPAQHPFAVIIGCSDSRVPPEDDLRLRPGRPVRGAHRGQRVG